MKLLTGRDVDFITRRRTVHSEMDGEWRLQGCGVWNKEQRPKPGLSMQALLYRGGEPRLP